MSTTEPTSIDEKKAEEDGSTTKKADWKSFSKHLINGVMMGIFFGAVVIGSAGLFLAKVANSNILPNDCDAIPYQPSGREVPIDVIYMNPVKKLDFYGIGFWTEINSKNYWIQEANFVNSMAGLDFMANFNNTWLCDLKDKATPPKMKSEEDTLPVSPFWTFEYETMKKMLCTSFSIVSRIFFYMNYLPEWATMIVFALFFAVILTLIFIANFIYGGWAHLSNISMTWDMLMHPRKYNEKIGQTAVQDPVEWYEKYVYVPFFFFLYFIAGIWSAIGSPVIITLYTFYKALSAEYVVRNKNYKGAPEDAPKMNLFSFIKNVMYYKKTFIIILVMINLMGITNEFLGTSYMPGVIIAILILTFGLRIFEIDEPTELYNVINPNFPPLVRTEAKILESPPNEPIETCNIKPPAKKFEGNGSTKITGKPINVLLATKVNGEPSIISNNEILKGGKSTSKSKIKTKTKTKTYNLKLV